MLIKLIIVFYCYNLGHVCPKKVSLGFQHFVKLGIYYVKANLEQGQMWPCFREAIKGCRRHTSKVNSVLVQNS